MIGAGFLLPVLNADAVLLFHRNAMEPVMSNRNHLPVDQSKRNAREAERAIALLPQDERTSNALECVWLGEYEHALSFLMGVPMTPSDMIPHPLILARAELNNAIRYR